MAGMIGNIILSMSKNDMVEMKAADKIGVSSAFVSGGVSFGVALEWKVVSWYASDLSTTSHSCKIELILQCVAMSGPNLLVRSSTLIIVLCERCNTLNWYSNSSCVQRQIIAMFLSYSNISLIAEQSHTQ